MCLVECVIVGCARPASVAPIARSERAQWERQAARVTIVRDDWGIAHVHGRSDADAVFGMVYAQAEDDFARIETNYLTALGRLAEAEGEAALWQDLRARLFADPVALQASYAASPAWLRAIMDGWAAGLNFFLATHPAVRPRALARFEPWMALAFTEGSIGGDTERVELAALAAFYGDEATRAAPEELGPVAPREPSGSNGIAIAPKNTATGHALLLINPHTSLFFRAELQVSSDDGLNAYGAVTWGQPFVYQGFNARTGWMHTSTTADAVDEYAEAIVRSGGELFYRHGGGVRPVEARAIALRYRTDAGLATRTFTTYRTHHGPIVRSADARWIAIRLMQRPIEALSQSFLRTKARSLDEARRVMALNANSSNNTVYADADGHIAYFHPQFVPRRDDRFDWTEPVDGSDPATEWRGVHGEDSPHVIDPASGYVMNTNNWPYSAAGADSPRRERFARYMDTRGENPRGRHARALLDGVGGFTIDKLRDAAFDRWLPAFATLLPSLATSYDALSTSDARRARLAEAIAALRAWDARWSAASIETTLAVCWGQALWQASPDAVKRAGTGMFDYIATQTTPAQQLEALDAALAQLNRDFGTWRVAWGEVNRYQRRTSAFDDAAPSMAVPFTSAQWGSLASFGARTYPGTKRMYGTSGNSFVAIVEFGPRVRARAVMAGGASGDPASPHFADQAARYAAGELREVYFEPAQLVGHTERRYRPGE